MDRNGWTQLSWAVLIVALTSMGTLRMANATMILIEGQVQSVGGQLDASGIASKDLFFAKAEINEEGGLLTSLELRYEPVSGGAYSVLQRGSANLSVDEKADTLAYQVSVIPPENAVVKNSKTANPTHVDILLATTEDLVDFTIKDLLALDAGNLAGTLHLVFEGDQVKSQSIKGKITSVTLTPKATTNAVAVPEPSTLALLAIGLLGLGSLRHRHKGSHS